MTFHKFCFLVFTHVLIANAQWTIEDESCRTPSGSSGTCVQIFSCKFIMDILDTVTQPIPRNVSNMLKAHHCGFSGKNPKVCCPKPKEDETELRNPVAPPPDVSKHKNYGLLPKNCGIVDTGDKIIHGNQTGLFEFPWMALLSYKTNRGPDFKCGATIINSRYILTAAHCISNLKNPLLGVRIGDHNINTQKDCETRSGVQICAPPFQDVAIEEIIPHPDYQQKNKNLANDIGLLRVTEMNINQENIRPVCLPVEKARNYNYTNRNTLVTGWGATEKKRQSPELLKAQIPTMSNEQCKEVYINETVITHKQLCAGGKTSSDSCSGDSGGPLHVLAYVFGDNRLVQQGIVSFGPKFCGLVGYPGVYTRVAYYMDWILDTIKP